MSTTSTFQQVQSVRIERNNGKRAYWTSLFLTDKDSTVEHEVCIFSANQEHVKLEGDGIPDIALLRNAMKDQYNDMQKEIDSLKEQLAAQPNRKMSQRES